MFGFDWFYILRPWWLIAIPIIVCGSWVWQRYLAGIISGIHNIDPALRPGMLLVKGHSRVSFFLLTLSLVLTAFALSGPGWSTVEKPIEKPLQATFILLDLSYSMAASDTKPSRYKRAQFKIADFVKRYSEQGPFAMIAYAGDAHLVVPLTDDIETLLNFVDKVYPGILPTAGSLPETALAIVRQIEADNGLKSSRVLLITDGIHQNSISAVSNYVTSQSLDLSILAVGEKSGVPITKIDGSFFRNQSGDIAFADFDLSSLEKLASRTESKIARLSASQRDLDDLFGDSLTQTDDETQASEATEKIPADQGYLFLLLILPLAFLSMRRGLFICFAALILMPDTSWALSWQDLWQGSEYQSEQLLRDKDYQQAQKLSKDPNKIGAALYGQKKYQQALEAFDSIGDATGSYNAGNSLMQLKSYNKAIERYQNALQQVGDNKTLKANIEQNLAIANKLLSEQQSQGQESQGQESQGQESQGQESQGQESQGQESQGQESQGQESQGQESQGQESQGQESQGQESQGQESQGQESQGQESQGQESQGQESQGQESQGQESQGQESQGQESQGQESQGQESQGQESQGQESQGHLAEQDDKKNEEENNKNEVKGAVSRQSQKATEKKSRQDLLLNLVKDNPGELLKRKFQLQQQQRKTKDSHDPL